MSESMQIETDIEFKRPFEKVVKKSRSISKTKKKPAEKNLLPRNKEGDAKQNNIRGIDVYVVWGKDGEQLARALDNATDWSPFELVDVIEVGRSPDALQDEAPQSEWLCRFRFEGWSKEARPYVASLLEGIDVVAPWTLSEKIFSNTEEANLLKEAQRSPSPRSLRDRPRLRAA